MHRLTIMITKFVLTICLIYGALLRDSLFSQSLYTTGTPFNLYFTAFAMNVGDFNRDGFMDVVASGKNDLDGASTITVLFGKGDGTFKNKVDLTSEKYAVDIQVADMDNDGFQDIITANDETQHIEIFINQKNGNFKQKDVIRLKGTPTLIGIGDFDKDGKNDIAVVIKETKEVQLYRGTSYKLSVSKSMDELPNRMRVDDYAGNGYANILLAYENASYISLLSAAENKSFKWEFKISKIDMLTTPSFAILADADNNSFDDAFVLKNSTHELLITTSVENGTLLGKQFTMPVPNGVSTLCIGDFNKDKKADVALLDKDNGQILIYLNQIQTPAPEATFSTSKVAVCYDLNAEKPSSGDVVMLGTYKSVSMILYNSSAQPARKYFEFASDLSDGEFTIEWTGTDENDAELPAGIYYFYYTLGAITVIRTLKK